MVELVNQNTHIPSKRIIINIIILICHDISQYILDKKNDKHIFTINLFQCAFSIYLQVNNNKNPILYFRLKAKPLKIHSFHIVHNNNKHKWIVCNI